MAKHIDFIVYELINPVKVFDKGLVYCTKLGFSIVPSIKTSTVTSELLSSILKDRKDHSSYSIDGIVISTNTFTRNTSGNPSYAMAYKESNESVLSKVIRVIWNISKDGYIKPIIAVKPITISGVIIKKATGFNAKFIKDHNIGKNAIVKIIRSGDVIPHIVEVIKEAKEPQMPTYPYVWNETGVDIMITNLYDSDEVKIKKLQKFFNTYGNIKGIKIKTIEKLYNNGIVTIKDYLTLTMDKLISIEGIDVKSARNILNSIITLKKEMSYLPKLMAASGCYSRGLGEERFKSVLNVYPNYLVDCLLWNKDEFIQRIIDIPQWQHKTAEQLYSHNEIFLNFYKDIKDLIEPSDEDNVSDTTKKIVVFTGFRDNELQKKFEDKNWIVKDSVTKKVSLVVRLNDNYMSNNIKKALEYGIEIINKE
jgi:DNA ligase (NAD+)